MLYSFWLKNYEMCNIVTRRMFQLKFSVEIILKTIF